MAYVIAAPEFLASAATDLANIRSAVTAAKAAATAPTTEPVESTETEVA